MRLLISSIMLFALMNFAKAQTVETIDGQQLFGEVISIDNEKLLIEVDYPLPGQREVLLASLRPASHFRILAARSGRDTESRLGLASKAEELGLWGHAIAELRRAARLEKALEEKTETRILKLESRIAQEILEGALSREREGLQSRAKLDFEVIIKRFPKSSEAKKAKAGVRRITAKMASEVRRQKVSTAAADRALKKAQLQLDKAMDRSAKVSKASGSTRDQRERKRIVKTLERGLQSIDKIEVAKEDRERNERIAGLRKRFKKLLHDEYIAIGTILVRRLALPGAEEWNVRACELDPNSGGCIKLQDQIIQARIISGYRGRR